MSILRKSTGILGEDLATRFLKKNGYKILERNAATKLGEIDILASEKNDIVVIEVKTKSTSSFGEGYEMVNYFKRKKLLSLARQLETRYPGKTIRIDVISIDLTGDKPIIKLFKNAIEDD